MTYGAVKDYQAVGLHVPCVVRLKLFTRDNRLILKRLGRLSAADQKQVRAALQNVLP